MFIRSKYDMQKIFDPETDKQEELLIEDNNNDESMHVDQSFHLSNRESLFR